MKYTLISLSALVLIGCATKQPHDNTDNRNFKTLDQLIENVDKVKEVDHEQSMLLEVLKNDGMDIGISNGYVYQMDKIYKYIEQYSYLFDRLLPFEQIIDLSADINPTEGTFILPGKVERLENSSSIKTKSGQVIIKREKYSYLLREQPKPVLRFPTWRDYLYNDNDDIELDSPLLNPPKNDLEKAALEEGITLGYQMGIDQANEEMDYRLTLAFKDLIGMTRYANVFDSGHLNKPEIYVENYANQVRDDELALGIQYVTLDGKATWASETSNYKAPFIDGRGSVRKEIQTLLNNNELTISDIENEIIKIK